ncbi:MAG: hypothetical protein ACRDGF_08230 [Chloroflexota bacterium]
MSEGEFRAVPDDMEPVHEDVAPPDAVELDRGRPPARSALTRWLAQRQADQRPRVTGPSYERCQERSCWGKATWACPRCRAKVCSAHRADHSCSLPYLP